MGLNHPTLSKGIFDWARPVSDGSIILEDFGYNRSAPPTRRHKLLKNFRTRTSLIFPTEGGLP